MYDYNNNIVVEHTWHILLKQDLRFFGKTK